MRPVRRATLCASFVFAGLAAAQPADLVLRGGAVYTVDAARSWAESPAISAGRIVYVGPSKGLTPYLGAKTRVVSLGGRMVLPGFHDSHVHLVQGGRALILCNLDREPTAAQAVAAVASYAAAHPRLPWIVGSGWELPLFADASPSRQDLDRAVPDRPAYIESADGHSAWVNSRALAAAGITASTPDPPGGRIEHDPHDRPSGTLRESATALVSKLIPSPSLDDGLADLERGLREANRFGIVSIQDADVDDDTLNVYSTAAARHLLTARVVAALHVDPAQDDSQVRSLASKRDRIRDPFLRASSVKIFADGVLEPGTAALLQPYLGRLASKNTGALNFEPERLKRLVIALDREGFQVHIHAIGDRAVRVSLDAHEAALNALGRLDLRPHIAHLELIDPADIPRFRQLGVIANFQGFWAWPDSYITGLTVPVLGPERSRWLYPIGSVIRTGAVIAGGSDWPVSSLNPLDAIQVAVTRRGIDQAAGPAWIPEECADLASMIAAYTIGGAWVNHEEHTSGSIEAGKSADLVVVDRNLFTIPREQIHTAHVLLTLLQGQAVFSDGALLPEK